MISEQPGTSDLLLLELENSYKRSQRQLAAQHSLLVDGEAEGNGVQGGEVTLPFSAGQYVRQGSSCYCFSCPAAVQTPNLGSRKHQDMHFLGGNENQGQSLPLER